jgi:hypothetical protein
MCFKYGGTSASDTGIAGTYASSCLVNNQLFYTHTANTAYKYGYVNYYQKGTEVDNVSYDFIPMMFRLSVKFDSADAASGTRINVFLDTTVNLKKWRTLND